MGFADLVCEGLVDVAVVPAQDLASLFPCRGGQFDSRMQQGFGIGFHPGSQVTVIFGRNISGTQLVGGGVGADDTPEQAVAGPGEPPVAEHDRCGAGADRE